MGASRLLLIPAAGRSIRMVGLLKELLPLVTRAVAGSSGRTSAPVLLHVLDAATLSGAAEVVIVTSSTKAGPLMEAVESFDLGIPISYVFQRDASGLGAAVSCASAHIRRHDATLIHMADVLIGPKTALGRLWEAVADGAAAAVTLHRVKHPERFGVARLDDDHVVGFVDKPPTPPSEWVWSAVTIAPRFLGYVDRARPEHGEWGLTEALDAAAASRDVAHVCVEDGYFHDVGSYDGYLGAIDEFRRMEEEG